jgi:hypothetical protein
MYVRILKQVSTLDLRTRQLTQAWATLRRLIPGSCVIPVKDRRCFEGFEMQGQTVEASLLTDGPSVPE